MREILFRGKTINGDWVYGLLAESKGLHLQPEKGFYISNGSGMPRAYQVQPSTIGQFTGLTDKNGKKIFEGQFLYVPYNRIGFIKVVFENGKFNAANYNLNSCTVYDTPKLLGGSNEHH